MDNHQHSEPDREEKPVPIRWPSKPTFAACIAFVVVCSAMGRVSSECTVPFQDMNMHSDWRMSFIKATQLGVALPAGFITVVLLILKDRWFDRTTAIRANKAAFGLLVLFILLWLYAVFSPIFVMREIRPN